MGAPFRVMISGQSFYMGPLVAGGSYLHQNDPATWMPLVQSNLWVLFEPFYLTGVEWCGIGTWTPPERKPTMAAPLPCPQGNAMTHSRCALSPFHSRRVALRCPHSRTALAAAHASSPTAAPNDESELGGWSAVLRPCDWTIVGQQLCEGPQNGARRGGCCWTIPSNRNVHILQAVHDGVLVALHSLQVLAHN